MSRCIDSGRPGCRGLLCRAAHIQLRQLPVVRYPAGDDGRPDLKAIPERGWICGLLSHRSTAGSGSLDIPGTTGGRRTMYIITAAGSLEPPIAAGDRIAADGKRYTACSVSDTDCLRADLIPYGEAE